jgi:hypothetical protein
MPETNGANGTVAKSPIEGVKSFEIAAAAHVDDDVVYPIEPPVGGPHNPIWQNCGIYDQPVRNEYAVHSLEHGAVWVTYQPGLAADQVAVLRGAVKDNPYALLSPHPKAPTPVVLSAWGLQLQLASATDPRLAAFLTLYSSGPQTPEPGAPCAGSFGTPLPADAPIAATAPTAAAAVPAGESFAPVKRGVWETTVGPDEAKGTCPNGSIVPPYGPVLLTPGDGGVLEWKDVQNAIYAFKSSAPNVYAYTGPNGRKDGVITMTLTFVDKTNFKMRADYVKSDTPDCTHGYDYAGVFKFDR